MRINHIGVLWFSLYLKVILYMGLSLADVMDYYGPMESEDGYELVGDMMIREQSSPGSYLTRFFQNDKLSWADHEEGIVFVLSADAIFSEEEVGVILSALRQLRRYSCIQMRLMTAYDFMVYPKLVADYVLVRKIESGCSAHVGRVGQVQHLNLGPGCFQKFVIMHEMIHSLGCYHEQSRVDRDKYVVILYDNIKEGRERNFRIEKASKAIGNYDYNSIMHYDSQAFAKRRGLRTIVSRIPYEQVPDQIVRHLSKWDVYKIKVVTRC